MISRKSAGQSRTLQNLLDSFWYSAAQFSCYMYITDLLLLDYRLCIDDVIIRCQCNNSYCLIGQCFLLWNCQTGIYWHFLFVWWQNRNTISQHFCCRGQWQVAWWEWLSVIQLTLLLTDWRAYRIVQPASMISSVQAYSRNPVRWIGSCASRPVRSKKFLYIALFVFLMTRAHTFLWAAKFLAKPRNLPFSAEFWYCRGILQRLKNDR